MAIAASSEDPSAIAFVGVRLGVEDTRARQIGRIKLRIFCVDVEDRVSKNTDSCDGVNVLPEHMARIVIATNGRACDLAEAQQRLRAVDHKAGMHLDSDFYAMVRCKLCALRPI